MGKRRQGPINKKVDFLPNKLKQVFYKKIHCWYGLNITWFDTYFWK